MNGSANQLARRAVAAPLAIKDGVNQLGRSLWLHLYLVNVANYAGRACRNVEKIAADLLVARKTIDEWLTRLSDAQLIDVISPSPFLVLTLRSWPGISETPTHGSARSGRQSPATLDVPVGSSSKAAAASSNEDGGVGEGGVLLREVTAAIDDADPAELQPLLERHSERVVREALRRVQATPASQIRKSRAALFRYLVAKLS